MWFACTYHKHSVLVHGIVAIFIMRDTLHSCLWKNVSGTHPDGSAMKNVMLEVYVFINDGRFWTMVRSHNLIPGQWFLGGV